MTQVKLASSLPDGDANGLTAVHQKLCDAPHEMHVVVALVDCKRITTETDTGELVPTGRVRRIEVITKPADGKRLIQLVRRAYEERTGQTVLPLDMEDELSAIFGDSDDAA